MLPFFIIIFLSTGERNESLPHSSTFCLWHAGNRLLGSLKYASIFSSVVLRVREEPSQLALIWEIRVPFYLMQVYT